MTATITGDADLDDLRRAANRLYQRSPCRGRINCIARERGRALSAQERCQFPQFPQWTERPYGDYCLARMCRACQAFWYAEMAARCHEEPPGIVTDAPEDRPLPKKG